MQEKGSLFIASSAESVGIIFRHSQRSVILHLCSSTFLFNTGRNAADQ